MDREILIFAAAALWIVMTGINAAIAKEKRLNVGAIVVASVILSPLVAWMYAAGMPSKQSTTSHYPPASQDTSWAQATSRSP